MKLSHTLTIVLAPVVIGLAGCAGLSSLFSTVTANTEAKAESAYIVAATLEKAYKGWPTCVAPLSVLNLCTSPAIVVKMKADDAIAYAALLKARASSTNIGLISAAITAAGVLKADTPAIAAAAIPTPAG